MNRDPPRSSADIDVFQDREERVAQAAAQDADILQSHGYSVQWLRREPAIYAALIGNHEEKTKLEWVADSDFRFFPTIPDDAFGYVLHPADLATNKVAAAFGRREPRDIVDLVTVHDRILPLGAAIWAAVGKAPGFTPEGVIDEIQRNARYNEADFRRIASDPPVDPVATMRRLGEILSDAGAFVAQMPTEKAGLLFLRDGKVVQPEPMNLENYRNHAGQRRGHWPGNSDIGAAMLEPYKQSPYKERTSECHIQSRLGTPSPLSAHGHHLLYPLTIESSSNFGGFP